MKPILIHGEDTVKSYERLEYYLGKFEKQGFKIKQYDLLKKDPKQVFEEREIFDQKIAYLFYNADSKAIKLISLKSEAPIIFYFKTKLVTQKYNDIDIETFSIPKIIYRLIDQLGLGFKGNIYQDVVRQYPPDFINALVGKRIWELMVKKEGGKLSPSWLDNKVSRQLKNIKGSQLKTAFKKISLLDRMIKDGRLTKDNWIVLFYKAISF